MSRELAAEGARALRPATLAANQREAARIMSEQLAREAGNLPGLSRPGLVAMRSAIQGIGDVANAAIPAQLRSAGAIVRPAPGTAPVLAAATTTATAPTRSDRPTTKTSVQRFDV